MKICSCGEVIYTPMNKDFAICSKCQTVMYVNESDREKNESRPKGERPEGQESMGVLG